MRVDVLTSGIWQTTTTIVSSRGACVVVDPAYFPRELDAIVARVGELGHAEAVVFTHGHWDHVMGHAALPGAPVWLSRVLDAQIAAGDPRAARYLDDARAFDSRWYVPRAGDHRSPSRAPRPRLLRSARSGRSAPAAPPGPPYRWPERRRGLADGDHVEVGELELRALALPGHSPDGLGLVIDALGLLLVGDYLSPCEIPFVDDAPAYRATVMRLLEVMDDVREVIPGHGPRLTRDEAMAIARADVEYLDRLIDAAARRDAAAARAIALPRAAAVVGMRDHHVENCARLGVG